MAYCPDCGCRTDRGICSNCQEELYILENQAEFITEPVSDEFAGKAEQQKEYLKMRAKLGKTIEDMCGVRKEYLK